MKKKAYKLVLAKETLRSLETPVLRGVAGGSKQALCPFTDETCWPCQPPPPLPN